MTNRTKLGHAEHAALQDAGINLFGAQIICDDKGVEPWERNMALAMDAQPTLVTTTNSGIPSFLTTVVDPQTLRILTSKNKAAQIFGEVRKGTWESTNVMFSVVEATGEVSSYGDRNNNGRAGINVNFPQRENYLFQVIASWGELEMERMGAAQIGYANEIRASQVSIIEKFRNLSYFKGIANIQNYGALTDPNLSASLSPATKAAGGTAWYQSGVLKATANEIQADIQAVFAQLVTQSGGNVDADTPMVLAMSPLANTAMLTTNSFGKTAKEMILNNFPNLRIETAVQYGAITAANPQGNAAGDILQLVATSVEGQDTSFCAFTEKLRTHPIIRQHSAFEQKMTSGTLGYVLRQPFAVSSMVGLTS